MSCHGRSHSLEHMDQMRFPSTERKDAPHLRAAISIVWPALCPGDRHAKHRYMRLLATTWLSNHTVARPVTMLTSKSIVWRPSSNVTTHWKRSGIITYLPCRRAYTLGGYKSYPVTLYSLYFGRRVRQAPLAASG